MLMRAMLKSIRNGGLRRVVFTLIGALMIIGLLPNTGGAAVIPAGEADMHAARAQNVAKIQATLERKEIAARLADYGLTPEEVGSRLDRLSDQQAAEISAQIDKINAGGDAVGLLISLALLALLVLLILHLLGYIDLKLPRPKHKQPS
ncbi:MAG TPA: PA2779 family protein [bacterium]|nr:PA2779 family protein [bacterium]